MWLHPVKNGGLFSLLVRSSFSILNVFYPEFFSTRRIASSIVFSGKSNRRANHYELRPTAGLRHLNPCLYRISRQNLPWASLTQTGSVQLQCQMCRYNGNACPFFDRGKEHSLQEKPRRHDYLALIAVWLVMGDPCSSNPGHSLANHPASCA